MKKCKKCSIEKPPTDFYKRKNQYRAKYDDCRDCTLKERKLRYSQDKTKYQLMAQKYRRENPEKIRDIKLKQTYGVGLQYYDFKLQEQGGVCAGCRQNVKQIWRGKEVAMALDHDHLTGKPRGVLCRDCNRSLGGLRDNKQILLNLIDYIDKYQN